MRYTKITYTCFYYWRKSKEKIHWKKNKKIKKNKEKSKKKHAKENKENKKIRK
jgi:hypothetical protein